MVEKTVVYQLYPRSFFDLNGDGIGDLKDAKLLVSTSVNRNPIQAENLVLNSQERIVLISLLN